MWGCGSSKSCGCVFFQKKKLSYEDESTSSCRSSEADVPVRGFRNRKVKPDGNLFQILIPRNLFRGWRRNEDLSMTKIERSKFSFTIIKYNNFKVNDTIFIYDFRKTSPPRKKILFLSSLSLFYAKIRDDKGVKRCMKFFALNPSSIFNE